MQLRGKTTSKYNSVESSKNLQILVRDRSLITSISAGVRLGRSGSEEFSGVSRSFFRGGSRYLIRSAFHKVVSETFSSLLEGILSLILQNEQILRSIPGNKIITVLEKC